MNVRRAKAEDIPLLRDGAMEFYRSSRFLNPNKFLADKFVSLWTELISTDRGVIVILYDGETITGAIGGMVYPDAYSDDRVATEFFWYVLQDRRGGIGAMRLYHEFEMWAREHECNQIRMVHLMDSSPEKLEALYKRMGFEPAEIHYVKEL